MNDVDGIGPDDAVPEADAVEQLQPADSDDDTGLDVTYANAAADSDANEADVIEQAYVVPAEDDEWADDH